MRKPAFSLIEIIVAMTIIGLLGAGIVLGFGQTRIAARDTKRIEDVSQIASALENYHSLGNDFPDPGGVAHVTRVDTGVTNGILSPLITSGLLRSMPIDPQAGLGSTGATTLYCDNYVYKYRPLINVWWNNAPYYNQTREYAVSFGSEEKPGNQFFHPLSNNIYLSGTRGCQKPRYEASVFGQVVQ